MIREYVVTLKKPPDGEKRSTSIVEVLKLFTTIIASVAIPIVLLIVGKGIEGSVKSKELETKYVEISVGILTEPPRPETVNLRKWAIDNINRYAEIKLSEEAQEELNTESLPSVKIGTSSPSRNFTVPSSPRSIEYVVIADTENATLESVMSSLSRPNVNASYHYVIGTDGTIEKLVEEENIAWHAGRSSWKGKENLNSISIGIGLVHLATSDGKNWLKLPIDHPAVGPKYPEAQIEALVGLLAEITERHGIAPDDVLTKQDIAPSRRKTDLHGELMRRIRARLSEIRGDQE
ncbi:N-acetylmuramoyl-L-alanine amidase [Microbulbifer sp. MLAF003]|uniref:N-acetylmuramoyl-L-alanine amidase n=1 Tax=unclassified Microbulbifer TaxID=2619833 RepID=UPI0024AE4C28|nr:N-acetylmuramoyl-L-alanine amidase [Microbulbifer sp. MLAF003]WHI52998.1 N-acetylmuramoyl-L-alanine amidase [Microbulbifer sp. MLAF003]